MTSYGTLWLWWVSGARLSDGLHDGGILRTEGTLSSPGNRLRWRQGPSGKLSGLILEQFNDGY